jgi:hypothetical protein
VIEMATKTKIQTNETALSIQKTRFEKIETLANSLHSRFADVLESVMDTKFTKGIINESAFGEWAFVDSKNLLKLTTQTGWYLIDFEDQKLIKIEVNQIGDYPRNKTINIHQSAFDRTRKNQPLLIGSHYNIHKAVGSLVLGCSDDNLDYRLQLTGDYKRYDEFPIALSIKTNQEDIQDIKREIKEIPELRK